MYVVYCILTPKPLYIILYTLLLCILLFSADKESWIEMKMIEMRRTNNNLEHLTKRVRLFYNTLNNIDPRYVKIKFVGIKEN